MAKNRFEVVIIGAGPAGLSAALWANELKLSAVVVESGSEVGGQLLETYNPIENHLGAKTANGTELRNIFSSQLKDRSVDLRLNSRIEEIDILNRRVLVKTGSTEEISFQYLVLATGVRRRTLGIPGEEEFSGRGILSSGKREASKAKGKTAVVIGGGDAAFENAIILSAHARDVVIVHRREEFSARQEFIDKVAMDPGISIRTNCEAKRFAGDGLLERIYLIERGSPAETELDAGVAVIRIGVRPNSELLENHVRTDESGYVEVDSSCMTSNETIFAVGDVANPVSPTVSTAVGMGATAMKSVLANRTK